MKNYCNYTICLIASLLICSGYASSSSKIEEALAHNEMERTEKIKKHDAAMSLIREGMVFFNKSQHDQAIQKFLRAREIVSIPLISQAIGLSYCEKKDYEMALFYFNEALILYSYLEWEIDPYLLEKLVWDISKAKSAMLRQQLQEKSSEMINASIKDALEKEKI